jgi:hypothetical protein
MVKVKDVIPVSKDYVMKAYKGSGGKATIILNIGGRWMRMDSFTLRLPFFRGSRSGTQLIQGLFQHGEKKILSVGLLIEVSNEN